MNCPLDNCKLESIYLILKLRGMERCLFEGFFFNKIITSIFSIPFVLEFKFDWIKIQLNVFESNLRI